MSQDLPTRTQNENDFSLLRSAGELAVAAAFVVAVSASLLMLARWLEAARLQQPVVADVDGTVTLLPYQATIEGELRLYPTDFEDQSNDFTYTHGRKVLKERKERRIGDWTDSSATVQWTFAPKQSGLYDVRLRLACTDQAAGGVVQVTVADETLSTAVKSSGGWDKWSTQKAGRVELNANQTFTISVRAESIHDQQLMNLREVKLIPVDAPS